MLNSNTIQSLMDKTSSKKDHANTATSGKESSNANILMKLSERKHNKQDVLASKQQVAKSDAVVKLNRFKNTFEASEPISESRDTPRRHSSHGTHEQKTEPPKQSTFYIRLSEITQQLNQKYKRDNSQQVTGKSPKPYKSVPKSNYLRKPSHQ